MDNLLKNKNIVFLLLVILSIGVLCVCSFSTSPFYHVPAYDQDMFYTIGRVWAEGGLPYVDAWDSKGPIIFFFNALGYFLTHSHLGVFIIQVMNLSLVLCTAYYLLCKYCKAAHALLYCIVFLGLYVIVNSGGNQVGDYTLFLSLLTVFATYHWCREAERKHFSHSKVAACLYGIFFASCLLSRLTNAAVLCSSVAVVFIVLCYHRMWKNILCNILWFLIGFALIFMPFAIYFSWHGAFEDMWYATFLYNIEYALHSGYVKDIKHDTPITSIYFYLYFACLNISFGGNLLMVYYKDGRCTRILWCIILLVPIGWILKSYAQANYVISYLPVIFVFFMEMERLLSLHHNRMTQCILYGSCVCVGLGVVNHIRIFSMLLQDSSEVFQQGKMLTYVPHGASLATYDCLPALNSLLGIRPYYPYFTCQNWAIENGASLKDKVRECFEKGDAEWILVYDLEHSQIRDILLRRYELRRIDRRNDLFLFQLK